MANKKKSGSDRVRVKNSYYTFSKTYPGGMFRRNTEEKRGRGKRFAKAFALLVLAAVFICTGYFGVRMVSEIAGSENAPSKEVSSKVVFDPLEKGELKAYQLNSSKIGDRDYLKKSLRRARTHDANAVIIDFKDEDGSILYSSNVYLAAGNAEFDNDTVRRAVSYFRSRGIAVFAGFCCFSDGFAAEAAPDMAVKYKDSSVNWVDASENPSPWLNPYSSDACAYLESLISEIRDFGVDGFILRNASFPASGDMDSAYYPGEKSTAGRNTRLAKFVSQVKKSTGVFVAVELSANIALSRNDAPFYGSFASLGDAVVFDTTDRPDGYYVDRNTDYSSMLTLLGSLVHVEECESIIKLGGDESSDHFIRALRSAGYKMVIIDA